MGIKSISWWFDIEEYQSGKLYNSFSAGPIARSWDDDGNTGEKYITIQELVDEKLVTFFDIKISLETKRGSFSLLRPKFS